MSNFVSLHNQTDYSILDSLSSVKALFTKAKELEQSALAITEHGSFASTWESFKFSKSIGVKLIIGCELYFKNEISSEDKMRHIILLAKNATGYKNLLTLNKKGFDQNFMFGKRVYSVIDWKMLDQYKEGLVCLTACGNGIVNQLLMDKRFDEAESTLLKLKDLFGDNLGLEVQPNNMRRGSNIYNNEIDQKFFNYKAIEFGKKHNIKVVPACNSHYVNKEDHDVHDVLLSIGSHQPVYSTYRLRYPVSDFYLKSAEEVKSFFARNYGDSYSEQICENSLYFADLCEIPEWIDPKYSNPSGKELPQFPVKDQADYNNFIEWTKQQSEDIKSLNEDKLYLRYVCNKNFGSRIKDVEESKLKEYYDRIEEELSVLEFHDFSSYMLIVADYIEWGRKNSCLFSPGRGSCAGSLVAYLQSIHQADSIKHDLIFARFHNKEKTSFPDIDVDVAPSKRNLVKDYLRNKYGDDNVAHVSNVNTITPKVYVRDICRACELGGSTEAAVKLGNTVADCIPADIHSIDEAIKKVPLFVEYCKRYPEFIKYKQICGKYRAWSTHAGGIIISKRPMTGLVPLRRDKDGVLALEYDKEKAEENGLVKMDILGLSTLDIIDQTNKLISANGKEVPENIKYDEYDQKTYDLISNGNTFCVFQFGTSAGTVDLCKRTKPKSIEDLANINALARPSARDMRNDFILTKAGKKPVALLHPNLQRSFGNTYGFGLYEESLMYLAQDIAGWNLHDADRLRKLTKEKGKNPEKVKKWKAEFIEGAIKNGVNEEIAKRIWIEVIEGFGSYGFNKSLEYMENLEIYDDKNKFIEIKPIKDVCIGDYVKSRDETTKKDIFIKIVNKHDHGILPLVEVELNSGEKTKCTMDHKFRVQETNEMIPLWKIIELDLTIIVGE